MSSSSQPHSTTSSSLEQEIETKLGTNWVWYLLLAAVFILGGVVALAAPAITSLSVTLIVAGFAFIGGLVQIFQSFRVQSWSGFLWQLLVGLLYCFIGIVLWKNPFAGMVTLTIMISAVLIATGLAKLIFGFRIKPNPAWGWIVASGVISALIGIMIAMDLSHTAWITLGVFLGIDLLANGIGLAALALRCRTIMNTMTNATRA